MGLYVKESGTPNAPTIIFVHGAGVSGWMWDDQTNALSDYHCLTVDLPGHGQSNHIAWSSITDTAEAIAAIIRQRATNGRAALVGLSLGSYVVMALLAQHPDLVERVIVSGMAAEPMPRGRLAALQVNLLAPLMKTNWLVRMQAKTLHIPPERLNALREGVVAMRSGTFQQVFAEVLDYHLPTALTSTHVPVLVTAGSDETPAVVQGMKIILKTVPTAQGYLAPGRFHAWNIEAPELFTAMIRAWLTGAPLPTELQPVTR